MSSKTTKKIATTMRMPEDMLARLDEASAELGWSRSSFVQQVLAKYLAEQGRNTSVRVVL